MLVTFRIKKIDKTYNNYIKSIIEMFLSFSLFFNMSHIKNLIYVYFILKIQIFEN